ncbi:MAG: cupin domain-containing protein [Verrucomicrobiota bacterium]
MKLKVRNLFEKPEGVGEDFYPLLTNPALKLEHIVSRGANSDEEFWYDQETDEWVVLLKGTAVLEKENGELIPLKGGDHLVIPAHCRHRVASTSSDAHWLALHCAEPLV